MYRFPLLCIVSVFAVLAFGRLQDLPLDVDSNTILGLFIIIWYAHISACLCAPKLPHDDHKNTRYHWHAAYKLLFNGRWIGHNRQAPHVRKRSSTKDSLQERTQVPNSTAPLKAVSDDSALKQTGLNAGDLIRSTKGRYILDRVWSITLLCGIAYLWSHLLLKPHPDLFVPLQLSDISPSKQSYIRHFPSITLRETIIRLVVALHFVGSTYVSLTILHDILSILFVGILRFDEPEDWPPLYGRLSEAYTLRRLWANFWHRLAYRPYQAYAALLSQRCLGLCRHSPTDLLFTNFTIFFISGLSHALVARQLGMRCGAWQEVAWYCLNFLFIVFEEIMQKVYRLLMPTTAIFARPALRMIGYVWVLGFLCWSLPKVKYPQLYCSVQDSLMM